MLDGLAFTNNRLHASECSLDLTLKQDERLLKVVPVRRRAAAWWDVHIDKAETPRCVFPGKKDGVSVSYQSDMR
jgi:hypothetical protein